MCRAYRVSPVDCVLAVIVDAASTRGFVMMSRRFDELDLAIGKAGKRSVCDACGEPIINTGVGFWDHVDGDKPDHVAVPIDDAPEDDNQSAILLPYHDAPEDELEDEDKILIESGILPKLIEAALAEQPSGKPWQQELADIVNPHAFAIESMEASTLHIANTLAGCGVHPALCASVEHQVRLVWTNAMKTVSDG